MEFVDNPLLATVQLHRFIAVDTCPAYQGPSIPYQSVSENENIRTVVVVAKGQ